MLCIYPENYLEVMALSLKGRKVLLTSLISLFLTVLDLNASVSLSAALPVLVSCYVSLYGLY